MLVPELPDVEVYIDALRRTVVGHRLLKIRLASPFLLRTVDPPLASIDGQVVEDAFRLHKRVVFHFSGERFLAFHPMRSGRIRWRTDGKKPGRKVRLGTLEFDHGALVFTEAASKKRAALHLMVGREALETLRPPGVEPLEATPDAFRHALVKENHTVKRSLTDPRLFAGIGNAYSDEILHAARLSPVKLTQRLTDAEIERLHTATRDTLTAWTARLRAEVGDGFPDKVTAFRPDMAVHGRFREPCPICGDPVQRIVYAARETNYCATCQTGGKVLADRALSRLLREDWPRTLEELEQKMGRPD